MSNRCIHDYLSFTFSPEPLVEMKRLARVGSILKSTRDVGVDMFDATIPTMQDAFIVEMGDMLKESLGAAEFLASEANYNDSYAALIEHYGVKLLDELCHAEIGAFVAKLNQHMSLPHSNGGRFTVVPRNGGMFGYTASAMIQIDDANAGIVAWGAANGGCMVSFSGAGCAGIDFKMLHMIVEHVPGFKITRVDLALDDYEGTAFDVGRFREFAMDGLFSGRGPAPAYTYIESGHLGLINPKELKKRYGFFADLGRSFYIGARQSGKLFRAYEKGKQMKSEQFPNWQRAEVEIRSTNREIPLDVLLNPDAYFAGAYPALAGLVERVTPTKIKTFVNTFKVIRQKAIENAAIQAGRLINYLCKVEQLEPADVCHRLTRHLDFNAIPARLKMPLSYELLINNGTIEPAI